ncbi:restriction endonuclease subunit S [Endozoicomonas sp. ONNA1]|uniref:restriction endonuclease subunit S n=1 Tax=Endozoicomonas sp. ONNA1 TaxID=2828740 RepID=UPI002147FD96|nr:restriction endonuclease subunit S [Endozoicomonas sp. ONNA1]
MKAPYRDIKIGDLVEKGSASIKTGPFGTQLKASEYVESGIPVINVRNIGFRDIREEKLEFINNETAARLSSHLLEKDDIVFGRKGAVERHAYIEANQDGWLQGSDCIRLRISDKTVLPRYVSYSFLSEHHKAWMQAQGSHGATMASLNQDIIARIPLNLPSIDQQYKVVSVLSKYDDLINNNNRRITLLEDMAQTLYREWFVHFRFPRHEQAKFVDSSLGRVPEGWVQQAFTKVADVLSGGTPKTTEPAFWGGYIPFFCPKDAPNTFYCMETEKNITQLGLQKCSSKLYPKDTVFITARGTVGKVALPTTEMAMNQSCYALRGKNGIGQFYLFLLTKNQVAYLKKNTGGATFDTIVKDTFSRMQVLSPEHELVEKFDEFVDSHFAHIANLVRKNSILKQQRDMLLPKLISGQIQL